MSKVRYDQSGYVGSSKSIRAAEAEQNGKLPFTRAKKVLATRLGITQRAAGELLAEIGPCEWHHTGKYARRTDYYCLRIAAAYVVAQEVIRRFPVDWEMRMNEHRKITDFSERTAACDLHDSILADELGVSVEFLRTAYYETWEDLVDD